jgi:hypothetical protein
MFQHNVQHMAMHGKQSGATARKLIANVSIAQNVLDATVCLEDTEDIVMQFAAQDMIVGGVTIGEDQVYYLVASDRFKFATGTLANPSFARLFYVVVKSQDGYVCSSKDERVTAQCVRRVQVFKKTAQQMAA